MYGLCSCGFYEGEQCRLELQCLECWCRRCGLQFCGGAGIGAGEMIGVLRLSPVIGIALGLLQFLFTALVFLGRGEQVPVWSCLPVLLISLLISLLAWVLFSARPWKEAAMLGRSAGKRREHGVRFSTVSLCPSFLFVFFGCIYWVLRAFFLHLVPVWRLFRRG